MSPQPAGRLARIAAAATFEELWACIPQPVNCTGECWDSCGPIGYSQAESDRLDAAGHRPPNRHEMPTADADLPMCTALTADRQCSVYPDRPTVCRVWGVSEVLPCNHGDCFTPLPLTAEESVAVMVRAQQIGGDTPEQRVHYAAERASLMATISRARLAAPPGLG